MVKFKTLSHGILNAFKKYKNNIALDIEDQQYKYSDLESESRIICNTILENSDESDEFVGVFSYRTRIAYSGILGVLLSGHGYLPLNPFFPKRRLTDMITLSGIKLLVLGEDCASDFSNFAADLEPLTVICPENGEKCSQLVSELPRHNFVFPENQSYEDWPQISSKPEDPAYLLFTSGSTGVPKGIAVTHKNVSSYVGYTIEKYGVLESDRFSQMFDLTFDLSVHDIFVSLISGARLCVPSKRETMLPAKFISEKQLTFWFSVPSVVMFMDKFKALKENIFPTLRYSLFCGEALTLESASQWQKAAPSSSVENLYGPTEATIAITSYVYDAKKTPSICKNSVVPIGVPFSGQRTLICNEDLSPVQQGDKGELALGGDQVTPGYFKNPELTSKRFVDIKGHKGVWYLTGDLAVEDDSGLIHYLGRVDDQLQIMGYRVELHEIDRALREASGCELAIAVPSMISPGKAKSVIGVIEGDESSFSKKEILKKCRTLLTDYMVPAKIVFVPRLELNSNGKISRKLPTRSLDK